MELNYATAEAEDNREKILRFIAKYIKWHCYPPGYLRDRGRYRTVKSNDQTTYNNAA